METNNYYNSVHNSKELILNERNGEYGLNLLAFPFTIYFSYPGDSYPITADLLPTRVLEVTEDGGYEECHYELIFNTASECHYDDALSQIGREYLQKVALPQLFQLGCRINADDDYSDYIPDFTEILEQFNYQTHAFAPENFRTMLLKLNESLHALGFGWDTNE